MATRKIIAITYTLNGSTSTRKFLDRDDAISFITRTLRAGGAILGTIGG